MLATGSINCNQVLYLDIYTSFWIAFLLCHIAPKRRALGGLSLLGGSWKLERDLGGKGVGERERERRGKRGRNRASKLLPWKHKLRPLLVLRYFPLSHRPKKKSIRGLSLLEEDGESDGVGLGKETWAWDRGVGLGLELADFRKGLRRETGD